MEKIEVTARFQKDGILSPVDFRLGKELIQVLNVGRRWETDQGRHILVMDHARQTHHLFLNYEDFSWYLVRDIIAPASKTTQEKV